MEKWIAPDDAPTEVDIEPDVFYDFFFSLPSIKAKNALNNLKTGYLEKVKDANFDDFHDEGVDVKGLKNDQDKLNEMEELEAIYAPYILKGERLPNEAIRKWKAAAGECTTELKKNLQKKVQTNHV